MKFGVAQTRDEDDRLLRGKACFAGDRWAEGTLWLHILRSDVAAGRIVSIDADAARGMPGVHAILTGADAEVQALKPFNVRYIPPGSNAKPNPAQVIASDVVRYTGEPLVAIVAESQAAALAAAEAVEIDIEHGDPITDARVAAAPGAPQIWPDGNAIFTQELGDRAAYENALYRAAHTVSARIDISCVTAVAMEPRNALAISDASGLTLYTGTQAPHRVRDELSHVLGREADTIRVVATDVGGSFGTRNGLYPEDVLAALMADKLGQPVRWRATRMDSFLSDTQSRPQSLDVTLSLDADLNFLALGVDGYAPVGGYVGAMSLHPMASSLPALAGVYRTPVIHSVMRGMHVNRMYMSPYRGAGRPEAIFVIERIIDIAAHRLNVDRADIRRRNMIQPDQMPYATPNGFIYDSGDFPKALEKAMHAADWDGFPARRAEAKTRGRLRGLGLCCAIETAGAGMGDGQFPEYGALTLTPNGTLTIAAGSGDSGQGHATVLAQIAERVLGWDGPVQVVTGDTGTVPQGIGTFGSRTTGAAGVALNEAARVLVAEATQDAARHLGVEAEDLTFDDGAFRVSGTNQFLPLGDLAQATGQTYTGSAFTSAKAGTWPNSVHLAEVEVDPETGALDLLAYTVVDDVGTVVNPLLLEGQIHGGVAQGLGQAFMEEIVYDDSGQLLTATLMDYAVPRASDLVHPGVSHSPTHTDANPLGVKGAGESGVVGSLAAGISAVQDALAPLGIEDIAMPATPHRIWQAIQSAKRRGVDE